MLDQTNNDDDTPLLSVSDDVYDAILLADAVLVVAKGREIPAGTATTLARFFAVRRCRLTVAGSAKPGHRAGHTGTSLMKSMVGG